MLYKSRREVWAMRGKEYEGVVFNDVEGTGTQFTRAQLTEIKDKYVMQVSIPILIAFIEQLVSFLTSNKPSINVVPVGDSSKHSAYVHRDIVTALFYLNNLQDKLELAIQDMCIPGKGYLYAAVGNFYQNNIFNIIIKCLDWRYVYIDPLSKDRDHQDAEMIFISTPMLKSKAAKIYNLSDEDLSFADCTFEGFDAAYRDEDTNYNTGTPNLEQTLIWIMECFEKVQATMYVLQDGTKVFEKPNPVITPEGKAINIVREEIPGVYVRRTLKVGNYIRDSRIMPITKYPIAVLSGVFNRSPYSYGIVHYVIELVYALQKAMLLTLENMQTMSNSGWIAPEGSIVDKDRWGTATSTPGGVGEYTPDVQAPNAGAPIQRQGLPISQAHIVLLDRIKNLVEYITGIYDLVQGNPDNAPQTLGATQSLQAYGTQRPKMYARRIDSALGILGDVLIQMYQAYAPQENIVRYINETGTMTEIMTNVSARLQQDEQGNQQVVPHPLGDKKASMIQDEATKEVKAILGDITQGQYNVRCVSSNDLPTARQAVLGVLQSLVGRMGNDQMAIAVAQMMLKVMDYPEIDKITRDVDVINQLQQQVQSLAQQLNEKEKELLKAKANEESAEKSARLSKLDSDIDKFKHEAKANVDFLKDKSSEVEKAQPQEAEPDIK